MKRKRIIIVSCFLVVVGIVVIGLRTRSALNSLAGGGLLQSMAIILQLPKRRHSKARRDKRRGGQGKLKPVNVSRCSQCGAPKLPHRICLECGYYEGKQILPPKKKKEKKEKK
jgi:large subunit ribosomal protein L32